MVLATDVPANGARARSASLLILYKEASTGAAVFAQLSDAGYGVTLCPVDVATAGRQVQLDSDIILLVAEDECSVLIEACRAIRDRTDRPIVAISQACDEPLVAQTLDAGADEFLPLSIGDRELSARIDAMLRRFVARAPDTWHVSGITIRPSELSVEAFGRRVFLTPIEFRLLSCLASAPGKAFTHETLMSRVWGAEYVDSRHYLRVYVRYLREKLEDDPNRPQLILSEWGVGYRLQAPARAAAHEATGPLRAAHSFGAL